MSRKGKSWHFFVVAILIAVFAWTAIGGVSYQYGDIKTTYILSLIHIFPAGEKQGSHISALL